MTIKHVKNVMIVEVAKCSGWYKHRKIILGVVGDFVEYTTRQECDKYSVAYKSEEALQFRFRLGRFFPYPKYITPELRTHIHNKDNFATSGIKIKKIRDV